MQEERTLVESYVGLKQLAILEEIQSCFVFDFLLSDPIEIIIDLFWTWLCLLAD